VTNDCETHYGSLYICTTEFRVTHSSKNIKIISKSFLQPTAELLLTAVFIL